MQTVSLVLENSKEIELGEFTEDQAEDIRYRLFGGLLDAPVCLTRDALYRIQSWLRYTQPHPSIDLTHPLYRRIEGKLAELNVTPIAA